MASYGRGYHTYTSVNELSVALEKYLDEAFDATINIMYAELQSMWNKKEYYFKDFGNGKVVGILDYFIIYESKSYSEAVKALFELVGMEYSERDFEVQEEASKWICVPDEEPNDRAIVEDYLAKRCISKETLDFCSVKQAENGDIAYQFKDQDGKIGRAHV